MDLPNDVYQEAVLEVAVHMGVGDLPLACQLNSQKMDECPAPLSYPWAQRRAIIGGTTIRKIPSIFYFLLFSCTTRAYSREVCTRSLESRLTTRTSTRRSVLWPKRSHIMRFTLRLLSDYA